MVIHNVCKSVFYHCRATVYRELGVHVRTNIKYKLQNARRHACGIDGLGIRLLTRI